MILFRTLVPMCIVAVIACQDSPVSDSASIGALMEDAQKLDRFSKPGYNRDAAVALYQKVIAIKGVDAEVRDKCLFRIGQLYSYACNAGEENKEKAINAFKAFLMNDNGKISLNILHSRSMVAELERGKFGFISQYLYMASLLSSPEYFISHIEYQKNCITNEDKLVQIESMVDFMIGQMRILSDSIINIHPAEELTPETAKAQPDKSPEERLKIISPIVDALKKKTLEEKVALCVEIGMHLRSDLFQGKSPYLSRAETLETSRYSLIQLTNSVKVDFMSRARLIRAPASYVPSHDPASQLSSGESSVKSDTVLDEKEIKRRAVIEKANTNIKARNEWMGNTDSGKQVKTFLESLPDLINRENGKKSAIQWIKSNENLWLHTPAMGDIQTLLSRLQTEEWLDNDDSGKQVKVFLQSLPNIDLQGNGRENAIEWIKSNKKLWINSPAMSRIQELLSRLQAEDNKK